MLDRFLNSVTRKLNSCGTYNNIMAACPLISNMMKSSPKMLLDNCCSWLTVMFFMWNCKQGCEFCRIFWLSSLNYLAMVDIVPNSQEIIGHGSFSIVYKARLEAVSFYLRMFLWSFFKQKFISSIFLLVNFDYNNFRVLTILLWYTSFFETCNQTVFFQTSAINEFSSPPAFKSAVLS